MKRTGELGNGRVSVGGGWTRTATTSEILWQTIAELYADEALVTLSRALGFYDVVRRHPVDGQGEVIRVVSQEDQ